MVAANLIQNHVISLCKNLCMDQNRWKVREFSMYRNECSRNGSGTVYGLVLECNHHYNTSGVSAHSCRAPVPNKTRMATNQKVIWPPIKKY